MHRSRFFLSFEGNLARCSQRFSSIRKPSLSKGEGWGEKMRIRVYEWYERSKERIVASVGKKNPSLKNDKILR